MYLSHIQEVPWQACRNTLFLYLQVPQKLLYVTMTLKVNETVLRSQTTVRSGLLLSDIFQTPFHRLKTVSPHPQL